MSGDIVVSDQHVSDLILFTRYFDDDSWFDASCCECGWDTTGSELVVEDAAYEHVRTDHYVGRHRWGTPGLLRWPDRYMPHDKAMAIYAKEKDRWAKLIERLRASGD